MFDVAPRRPEKKIIKTRKIGWKSLWHGIRKLIFLDEFVFVVVVFIASPFGCPEEAREEHLSEKEVRHTTQAQLLSNRVRTTFTKIAFDWARQTMEWTKVSSSKCAHQKRTKKQIQVIEFVSWRDGGIYLTGFSLFVLRGSLYIFSSSPSF